jgi:SAM-dependent methyltransferase
MRPDLIADLFEKEADYWWNVSKRGMVLALARSRGTVSNRGAAGLGIDIGCGAGYTARVFESTWRMVGVDLSGDALQFCRRRGLRRLCQVDTTAFSLPFKAGSFDLVMLLDVIEHVEDDVHALAECRRILRAGGLLILTVPAFMTLWSPWDEALGHRRRYTARGLANALQQAGLSTQRLSYMFFFVFPIAVVIRGVKRLVHRSRTRYTSDFIPIPKALNTLLVKVGRLEQWIITRLNINLPFGLSVIAAATCD